MTETSGIHMNNKNMSQVIMDSHEAAFHEAVKVLPEIDAMTVIELVYDIVTGARKPEDVKEEMLEVLKAAGTVYANEMAENILTNSLKASDHESLRKLGKKEFADKLLKSASPVNQAVRDYFKGKTNLTEFVKTLSNTGIKDVGSDIASAFGYDLSSEQQAVDALLNTSMPVMAYAASMAAYQMCMEALDDAHLAHEERVRVQKQCEESIKMIRKYRLSLEEAVEKYLSQYMSVFLNAMTAMDQAVIDNDTDGYISANNEITSIMGHDVQFHNQDEFDALMNSEEALKL